ncbi:MAG: RNA polymerase sigma factor, partial [Planctomycetota bacterium]
MSERTAELVRRALAGDGPAFAVLVDRYQGMVCALALEATGCFAEAEDIAQDVLVDAYRRLGTLRSPAKFPAWLRAIAVNKIRSWLRRKKARREVSMDFKTNGDAAGAGSGPPERSEESLTQAVLKAVERLPEGQRQAITLYYMDGQSYPDIADFLSVPVSTVNGRMHAGRSRLKKEMAEMVGTVLDANKPGRELTVRVLRQAVGKAREAGRRRDYQSLLEFCDEALAALGKLPATPRRRKTRAEVLGWQGGSKELWLARPGQALTCHRAAMEIAADMDDLAGQARATQAILATLGRSGNFDGLAEQARRGLEVARAGQCAELLAICSAAVDLCADPGRRHDTGAEGGFALGWFGISSRRGRWVAEAPQRWERRTGEGNVMLNLRCGVPARPTVLSWLYGPAALLSCQPRVGDQWRGTFGSSFRSTPARALSAVSCVEAVDETLTVPAGRFRQCVRVRTTVRSAMKGPIPEQLARSMKVLTCTRWSWFSPGVGLVRLVNVDRTDQLTDIVLADFGPGATGREHLPLAPGNWWRYQWRALHPEALLTETWRVVEVRRGRAVVSSALHSREPDEAEKRQHERRTVAFLQKRPEAQLQGHA